MSLYLSVNMFKHIYYKIIIFFYLYYIKTSLMRQLLPYVCCWNVLMMLLTNFKESHFSKDSSYILFKLIKYIHITYGLHFFMLYYILMRQLLTYILTTFKILDNYDFKNLHLSPICSNILFFKYYSIQLKILFLKQH